MPFDRAKTGALEAAKAALGASIVIAAGAAAINWLVGAVCAYIGLHIEPQRQIAILLGDGPISQKVSIALTAIVIAPLVEESIFRVGVFRWLLLGRLSLSVVPAACISAAIFAAVHLYWPALASLAFIGFMLAMLYARTRRFFAPVLCHALFNAYNVGFCLILNHSTPNP